jgi:hypothetical protein
MRQNSSIFSIGNSDVNGNGSFVGPTGQEVRVFEELLDAEVLMNPAKLREAARQGIPNHFRAAVYRYLLGVASMDKSKEMTFEQMQEEDFNALEASYIALYGEDGNVGGGVSVGGGAAGGGAGSSSGASTGGKGGVLRQSRPVVSSSTAKWNFCCHDDPLSAVGDAQHQMGYSLSRGGHMKQRSAESSRHMIEPSMYFAPMLQELAWVPHENPWEAAFSRCRLLQQQHQHQQHSNFSSNNSFYHSTAHLKSATRAISTSSSSSAAVVSAEEEASRRRRMESALRALRIKHPNASRDEVDVIFSFVSVFVRIHPAISACEVFHLTESMFSLQSSNLNAMHTPQILQDYCGMLLMLFHATNAELYQHFHAEGVLPQEWVPDYMRCLLTKQLHLDDLLRLLDAYLADCSETGGFPLHVFVCLSLLSMLTEDLMEMDRTQILSFLHKLPRVDTEVLLQQALSVRESVLSRELL